MRKALFAKTTLGWIALAVILRALPLSFEQRFTVLCLAGTFAVFFMLYAIRKYKPVHPSVWLGFTLAAALETAAFWMRLLWPEVNAARPDGSNTPTDFFVLAGLITGVASMTLLGRWKDDPNDSSALFDSIIMTSGIGTVAWLFRLMPVLQTQEVAVLSVVLALVSATTTVCLAFSAIRLVLISSEKTVASRRLGAAAALTAGSHLGTLDQTQSMPPTAMVLAIMAMLIVAWSASDPSMARLARRGVAGTDRIAGASLSRWRFGAMACSSLVAPVALLYSIANGKTSLLEGSCLVGAWAFVAILVSIRLTSLVKNREAVAATDRRLAASLTELTTANDLDSTFERAASAIRFVLDVTDTETIIAVVNAEADGWHVRAHAGPLALTTRMISPLAADELIEPDGRAGEELIRELLGSTSESSNLRCYAEPMSSQDRLRGCLFVATPRRLTPSDHMALRSIAGGLVAAMDAFSLTQSENTRKNEQHFRALVENSTDLILVVDAAGKTKFASPAADRLLAPQQSTLDTLVQMLPPEDQVLFAEMLQRCSPAEPRNAREFRLSTPTGMRWLEVHFGHHADDELIGGIVINARDISERKILEEGLRHQALHDELTGIPNRTLFRDRVQRALLTPRSGVTSPSAVLFIDIDDFKTVNDGLGHSAGDELLKVIAYRLSMHTRQHDTAARLGGDEFAVLLEGVGSASTAMEAAERILASIVEPLTFGNTTIAVSASIGVTMTAPGISIETLLRDADVAMYHAKRGGKNQVRLFDQSMTDEAMARLGLKAELPYALERSQLHLAFQRIVDLQHGYRDVSREALLRWTHPTMGAVDPEAFIPIAEETGSIHRIGEWVLREASSALMRSPSFGTVNVNVSPVQLSDPKVVETVRSALRDSGMDADRLVIEVTEGSLLDDDRVRSSIVELGGLGCRIAMDDFGSGFASYASLQRLPFTDVKIDHSLVAGVVTDPRALAQIETIVQMGHALGLSLTAEGIETNEQAKKLAAAGIDFAQGFLFGKPVPMSDEPSRT